MTTTMKQQSGEGVLEHAFEDIKDMGTGEQLFSPEQPVGPYTWQICVERQKMKKRQRVDYLGIYLKCASYASLSPSDLSSSSFEVTLLVRVYSSNPENVLCKRTAAPVRLDSSGQAGIPAVVEWAIVSYPDSGFYDDEQLWVELRFAFKRSFFDSFRTMSEKCEVRLSDSQGEQYWASGALLGFHSEYFAEQIRNYKKPNTSDGSEISLSLPPACSASSDLLIDFLRCLHHFDWLPSPSSSVRDLLDLAERTKTPLLTRRVERFLMSPMSGDVAVVRKLFYAEKYGMQLLKNCCLEAFDEIEDIVKCRADVAEAKDFDETIKATVQKRLMRTIYAKTLRGLPVVHLTIPTLTTPINLFPWTFNEFSVLRLPFHVLGLYIFTSKFAVPFIKDHVCRI